MTASLVLVTTCAMRLMKSKQMLRTQMLLLHKMPTLELMDFNNGFVLPW